MTVTVAVSPNVIEFAAKVEQQRKKRSRAERYTWNPGDTK